MALPKPPAHIDWVPSEDAGKVTEPIAGKKANGYVADERPPAKEHNWIFARIGNWQAYFDSVFIDISAASVQYDAIVGVGTGKFLDINAAIVALSAGARIFVEVPLSLTATQVINLNDIEISFSPLAVMSQATTLGVGMQVTGERVRIIRPRFADWDNNAADLPLQFTPASKNCLLDGAFFFNSLNPLPLDDSGVNNTINNVVEEV